MLYSFEKMIEDDVNMLRVMDWNYKISILLQYIYIHVYIYIYILLSLSMSCNISITANKLITKVKSRRKEAEPHQPIIFLGH